MEIEEPEKVKVIYGAKVNESTTHCSRYDGISKKGKMFFTLSFPAFLHEKFKDQVEEPRMKNEAIKAMQEAIDSLFNNSID